LIEKWNYGKAIRMSSTGPMLSDDDFAQLSFNDKLRLSWALFKGYGLRLLGFMLVASIAFGFLGAMMMNFIAVSQQTIVSFVLGLVFVMAVLYAFFMLGLNALVLRYAEGDEPEAVLPLILSPWTRLGPVLSAVLTWLLLVIVYELVWALPGGLPYLGPVIRVLSGVLLSVFVNCALFHGADNLSEINPTVSLTGTWLLVSRNFSAWLQAVFTLLLANLPGIAMIFWVGSRALLSGGNLMPLLPGLFYCLAVTVYGLFLLALTYRQSRALVFRPPASNGNRPFDN